MLSAEHFVWAKKLLRILYVTFLVYLILGRSKPTFFMLISFFFEMLNVLRDGTSNLKHRYLLHMRILIFYINLELIFKFIRKKSAKIKLTETTKLGLYLTSLGKKFMIFCRFYICFLFVKAVYKICKHIFQYHISLQQQQHLQFLWSQISFCVMTKVTDSFQK